MDTHLELIMVRTAYTISHLRIVFDYSLISEILAKIREYMDVFAHVSLCASVLMIVSLTCERHFAIRSPHAVSTTTWNKSIR